MHFIIELTFVMKFVGAVNYFGDRYFDSGDKNLMYFTHTSEYGEHFCAVSGTKFSI